jgi:hypothetical protein
MTEHRTNRLKHNGCRMEAEWMAANPLQSAILVCRTNVTFDEFERGN